MSFLRKYALLLLLPGLFTCQGPEKKEDINPSNTDMINQKIDWQGHRGARGLLPENTIPAFLEALKYPITTLELDVVITKDEQVLISHEPWLSPEICVQANGEEIPESEPPTYLIMDMDYEQIQTFNCGQQAPGFPEQQPMGVAKPLLVDMIDAVEKYCRENDRELPHYNIEIKSRKAWDGELTPQPERFAALLLAVLTKKGIVDRTCIQSFDVRSLEAVHQQRPQMTTAYLVGEPGSLASKLDLLSFTPTIYSPYYKLLSEAVVSDLHERDIRVIPWTVNDSEAMRQLVEMGVDGIITDYPNRIPAIN
ncbi:MAG TPA: glycerophosphodiester phosphodiesterase family protein [Saprospiraceae bacterium]|nr:glycerophosphodiester phosphodiesterase family protein [Saprospiraceae bacterium]